MPTLACEFEFKENMDFTWSELTPFFSSDVTPVRSGIYLVKDDSHGLHYRHFTYREYGPAGWSRAHSRLDRPLYPEKGYAIKVEWCGLTELTQLKIDKDKLQNIIYEKADA